MEKNSIVSEEECCEQFCNALSLWLPRPPIPLFGQTLTMSSCDPNSCVTWVKMISWKMIKPTITVSTSQAPWWLSLKPWLNAHWTNLVFLVVVPPGQGLGKLRHCKASSHAVSVLWINRELQSLLVSMESLPPVPQVQPNKAPHAHKSQKHTDTKYKAPGKRSL